MSYFKGSIVVKLLRKVITDKFQYEMKIISITGDNNDDFIKFLLNQVCDDVLSKDIKKCDLEIHINILLSK